MEIQPVTPNKLPVEVKIQIISECTEVLDCVRLLIAAFEDADLKNHITLEYTVGNDKYELSLKKLNTSNQEEQSLLDATVANIDGNNEDLNHAIKSL